MKNQERHVVACIIVRDEKYLIAQRPDSKDHSNLWEFPGGKLEEGESLFDAAKRELKEEIDIEVLSAENPILSIQDKKSPFIINYCRVNIRGEPKNLEHKEIRWEKLEDIRNFELHESDQKALEILLNSQQLPN